MTDDKKKPQKKKPAAPGSKFSGPPVTEDAAEKIINTETATPQKKITAQFNSVGERNRNIFYSLNAQAIHEFHALIGHDDNKGRLTKQERELLAQVKTEATAEAKKYDLPLEVMESLLLAQKVTGVDHDAFMTKVLGPQPQPGEVVSDTTKKAGAIKIDLLTWLHLVKEHGREHGMGYFADRIKEGPGPNGTTSLEVEDPALLREIAALRSNPRLLSIMAAEQVKHETEIPQLTYKGVDNYTRDPAVAKDQQNLRTLGFDIGVNGADGVRGPFTQAAEKEFGAMSNPSWFSSKKLQEAADKAVADCADFKKRFKIDITPDQAFAIRNASKVGGADFDLMMKLVKRESNFRSEIAAQTKETESKKAVGLFQFKPGTWLGMIKRYGEKYGLGELADSIKAGKDGYTVKDPWLRDHIMSLRKDPRISSLMGAEFLKENKEILENAFKREPSDTDQYMAHFLGAGGAVNFIREMKKEPGNTAAEVFPRAAEFNHGVFYKKDGSARTLQEVYSYLAASFNTADYDSPANAPKKAPVPRPKPLHH
ncbi:MAG: hypothetical protein EPN97_14110 [Alphaproteobacteria bacterium]|nr:MAG: hypothetical protein EPN97_14110 [Alphaproteobacteria bacterium]